MDTHLKDILNLVRVKGKENNKIKYFLFIEKFGK